MKRKTSAKKRRRTGRKTMTKILVGLLVVFFMSSAMAIFFEQETQLERIQAHNNELSILHDKATTRKAEYEDLLAKSDSLEYIEQIAREQLGMVKPGETLFID